MVNLDNIFNKFFPRSQTSPWGKKLIYLAWAIEILVACVGLTFAYIFFKGGGQVAEMEMSSAQKAAQNNMDSAVVGLAFVVVAVMELTKIPLAYAVYYSTKITWGITFVFALLAVNFSTFETIIQGFELNYNQRSRIVNIEHQKLQKLLDEETNVEIARNRGGETEIKISTVQEKIKKLNDLKTEISIQASNQIANLEKGAAAANPRVKSITEDIDSKRIEKQKTNDNKSKAILSLNQITGITEFGARNKLEIQINQYDEQLKFIDQSINSLIAERDQILGQSASRNQPQIQAIQTQLKLQTERYDKEIANITINELAPFQLAKQNISQQESVFNKQLQDVKLRIEEQKAKLNNIAAENQIWRLAVKIKIASQWFTGKKLDKAIDTSDLTQEDVDTAFWIWFGGLSFVISIIGTLLAFAGLHLQDQRSHEIRNKPQSQTLKKLFKRLNILIIFGSRYLLRATKNLLKPKIVEKEVEKIVEKIVEVPVVEEKIVYQRIEVPKEVLKREIVHVPLWTNDPELLKKKFNPSEIDGIKNKK